MRFPSCAYPTCLQLVGGGSITAHASGALHDPSQVNESVLQKLTQLSSEDVEFFTEPMYHKDFEQKVMANPTITFVRISSGAATVVQGLFACKVLAKEIVPSLGQSSRRGEL